MIVEHIYIDDKIFEVYMGENAIENDKLISSSHPMDIWFHLDGVPSAHLVLKSGGSKITKRCINEAGSILYGRSKRARRGMKVIYTEICNLRKTEKVGCVTTKNERYIKF